MTLVNSQMVQLMKIYLSEHQREFHGFYVQMGVETSEQEPSAAESLNLSQLH